MTAETTVTRPALRTPLYLIMSTLGALILIGAFLPWASVDRPAGSTDAPVVAGPDSGAGLSISGMDAGGWGPAAIVAGFAIALIALIGYFWNPFSDPEAVFIGGFALVTLVAALVKIADAASLIDPDGEWIPQASSGIGLWLVAGAAALALVGAAWIVFSRPAAEARLA